jgi:hypothetical protein
MAGNKPYREDFEKRHSVIEGMFQRIISIFRKMPITVAAPISAPATKESLLWAVSKGALLLFLQNEAFSNQGALCRKAVMESLAAPLSSRPIHFTYDPQKAGDAAFRLILAFEPAKDLSAGQLARNEFRPRPASAGLHILLVFAREEEALSWVEGRIGDLSGIDDKAFTALLRQCVRELLGKLPT